MSRDLSVVGLGRMPYVEALELQRRLANARIHGTLERDLLVLVEHPSVVTLGRTFRPQHLPLPREQLTAQGIQIHEIERGGDVTYHGPGQLVGYPILDLKEHRKDLHWFLRQLEQALMTALETFGLTGRQQKEYTGVWIDDRKIASIGIHVKQWVTWHGFALNVLTNLSHFDLIVPCGIPDVVMTSIARELGEQSPRDLWGRSLESVVLGFAETFGQRAEMVPLEDLTARVEAAEAAGTAENG